MAYVGIQTQQTRNNIRSIFLLCLFPMLVVLLTFFFSFTLLYLGNENDPEFPVWNESLFLTRSILPYVLGGVLIWFIIAYFANTKIIRSATGATSLSRKENMRVYNLVENLCMSKGMKMPKLNVMEDDSLNAYASGINDKTYTVTLTRGIIDKLDDDELEGVIAHELSHIRNRDVRLLIVSIVFVGIFSMIAEITLRMATSSSRRSSRDDKGGGGAAVFLIVCIAATVGYLLGTLMRFAISRKREYLADAGAAEMTHNPMALASALRKISADPNVEAISRDDVAQLFIEHPKKKTRKIFSGLSSLFATHPPIEKRIAVLEQF